jgi:thioredoxin 1
MAKLEEPTDGRLLSPAVTTSICLLADSPGSEMLAQVFSQGKGRHKQRRESMSSDIVHVNDQDFVETVVESDLPVLVDFWADWCGPCHIVAPVVEDIAAEQAGRLRVAKLNVDESPFTAQQYGVQSIPTLILFRDGEEQGRVVGAQSKDFIAQALLHESAA